MDFIREVAESAQSRQVSQRSKCERQGRQPLLPVDDLVSRPIPWNVVEWSANQRTEEVFRIISALDKGDRVRIEVKPPSLSMNTAAGRRERETGLRNGESHRRS